MPESKIYTDNNRQPVEDREQRKFVADPSGRVAINYYNADLRTQKYVASTNGFAIAATATDIARIIGSASKIIRVKKVIISGRTTSGSPVAVIIKLLKYSTANTAGTSVATPAVPLDSSNAVATAVVNHYTANPTLGTLIGNVATRSITFESRGAVEILQLEFETPIILRGVVEQLSVNFNATSVVGSSIACGFEWDEV